MASIFNISSIKMRKILVFTLLLTSCTTVERNSKLSYSDPYAYSNRSTFCPTSSSVLIGGAFGGTLAIAAPVAVAAGVGVATALSVWIGNDKIHGPTKCLVLEEE